MNPPLDDNLKKVKTGAAAMDRPEGRMAEPLEGTDEGFDW